MNKKLVIPAVVLLGVFLIAGSIAVFVSSINVDATVSEPFETTTIALDFSGYAGETITKTVDINNKANVPLQVQFTWTEGSNVDGVEYTTDMPKTVTLDSGLNTVDLVFVYEGDTPTGAVDGTITLDRV